MPLMYPISPPDILWHPLPLVARDPSGSDEPRIHLESGHIHRVWMGIGAMPNPTDIIRLNPQIIQPQSDGVHYFTLTSFMNPNIIIMLQVKLLLNLFRCYPALQHWCFLKVFDPQVEDHIFRHIPDLFGQEWVEGWHLTLIEFLEKGDACHTCGSISPTSTFLGHDVISLCRACLGGNLWINTMLYCCYLKLEKQLRWWVLAPCH